MKAIFLSLSFLFTASALASGPFTLTDQSTGATYRCGLGGGTSTDPNCAPSVTDYCNRNTGYSASACFDKATSSCAGAPGGYSNCVSTTTDYCNRNTGYSASACFDKSLQSCKGSASATIELFSAVRTHTIMLEKGFSHEQLKSMNGSK